MHIVLLIISVLVFLGFSAAGGSKLASVSSSAETRERLGVPPTAWKGIGVLELAGAAGLLLGFVWLPLGVAAAGGLTVLTVGALVSHIRVSDKASDVVPAMALGVLSAAAAVLFVAVR